MNVGSLADKQEGCRREKKQADREKETCGRTDVETGTDRQTWKFADRQTVTDSIHAEWWVMGIKSRTV